MASSADSASTSWPARDDAEPWRLLAIEINLRLGGTTHPFLALRFLCGGDLDRGTGGFRSASGRAKYYRSTDNLQSPRYRGLLPEDLLDLVATNQLNFDHRSETGVVFHMIGALSQYGKLGLTAIGNSDGGGRRDLRPDAGGAGPGDGVWLSWGRSVGLPPSRHHLDLAPLTAAGQRKVTDRPCTVCSSPFSDLATVAMS